MATETRRPAEQDYRTYAVRLESSSGSGEVADGLTEFLDAVDCALEWLDRVDPERGRTTRLVILETRAGVTEEVWRYPSEPRNEGQAPVDRLGYNPAAGSSGVREFSAARQKTNLSDRLRLAPGARPARQAPLNPLHTPEKKPTNTPPRPDHLAPSRNASYTPAPAIDPATTAKRQPDIAARTSTATHESQPAAARVRRPIQTAARNLWDDPLHRTGLLLATAAVWVAIALLAPHYLTPLLLPLPAIYYWRRHAKTTPPDEHDSQDDLL